MADVRLYILAGTFLAFVAALIWFVVALARARRISRQLETYHNTPSTASEHDGAFDANLEGLSLVVASDAPSASLLTPLQTGEWQPEDRSLSSELLKGVTLEERIDTYRPAPNVPEPAFNVQTYQPWEVAEAPSSPPVEEPSVVPAAPAVMQPRPSLAELIPEVGVDVPTSQQPADEADLELEEEIAALLPHGLDDDELAEAAIEEPATAPEPVEYPVETVLEQPAEVPAQIEYPVETPALEEPPPAEVDEAEEVVSLDEAFAEMGWDRPEATPASRETAAAPQVVVHAVDEPVEPAHEPQGLEPLAPRPAVRVTSAEPPAPQQPVTPPPVKPAKPRPIVTIAGTAYAPATATAAEDQPPRRDESEIPELVMLAPVEMWFGDSRVGVKEGSATYDRFRKYADVLFEDLKASRASSR